MVEAPSLKDIISFGVILFWPVIPLFWIPVHVTTIFFRKMRLFAYILPIFIWLLLVYLLFSQKDILLSYRISIPPLVTYPGWILFILGIVGQLLTTFYLRYGIVGIPEVSERMKMRVVKKGPFALSRHPTYLAHTLIFAGAFLLSGVLTVALITMIDFLTVQIVIIPLEERELQRRFGQEYEDYMKKVPRFFPRLRY